MGLILNADCGSCGFTRSGLRLGATHEQIGQHDVCARELFAAACCSTVVSVLVYLGQPYPDTSCEDCEAPLPLNAESRFRISTLKGEVLDGHACPGCGKASLAFQRTGSFT